MSFNAEKHSLSSRERDLIIHFQQISRAAALYIRALLGGVKRALEVYRRVDETTKTFPWSLATTEEKWHSHAEGILMVALTTLNLPAEAWKSARILRAVPNCRLVLMMSYHLLSPALSVEENGLMAYLQTPPDVGGDWWSFAYGYSIAPSFRQNSLEALSSK